jgi:hypothetical protein
LERHLVDVDKGKMPMQKTDARFDLHVHCVRKKLADTDGNSVKWALDAIARDARTVLDDDSPAFIRACTVTQEQGEPEKTVFTLTEIDS